MYITLNEYMRSDTWGGFDQNLVNIGSLNFETLKCDLYACILLILFLDNNYYVCVKYFVTIMIY